MNYTPIMTENLLGARDRTLNITNIVPVYGIRCTEAKAWAYLSYYYF